jgi:hypothetical protein
MRLICCAKEERAATHVSSSVNKYYGHSERMAGVERKADMGEK